MINRRSFLKSSVALGALAVVSFPTIGCSSNATAVLNTVLNSAQAVLAVAEPNAPWAGDFKNAISALENAETQWKAGGAVTVVISALNTLAAVAAVIPFTATYSPLIDILVAGIDAVIVAIAPTAAPTVSHNARIGRIVLKKPHALQSEIGAYKAQWNAIVSANPALSAAKLK